MYPQQKLNNNFGLFSKDLVYVLAVLFIAFISVYYITFTRHVIFLIFLFFVWRTRKDYLWLAIIFLLANFPGGLFHGTAAIDQYPIPLYVLAPGVSFSFFDLYFFLVLVKSYRNRHSFRIFYIKYYQTILVYLALLLVVSFIIGMNFSSISATYKTFIKLTFFYSIHFIVKDYNSILRFFAIVFPFVFLAILLQLYGIAYGQQLVALFKPGVTIVQGVLEGEQIRPIEMGPTLLLGFVGSLFLLASRSSGFNKTYLIVVNLVAFISVMMTATRSWFITFLACYLYFTLFNTNRIAKNILVLFSGVTIFLLINFLVPEIQSQIENAWTRIETIEELAKGDVTAGGTLTRITERLPRVMEGFKQSTIVMGAGFSDLFYQYSDTHVTYANILLNTGVLGLILLLYFVIKIFFDLQNFSRKTTNIELRYRLKNVFLGFIAVLLLSTSISFFGIAGLSVARIIALSFIFAMTNVLIKQFHEELYSK